MIIFIKFCNVIWYILFSFQFPANSKTKGIAIKSRQNTPKKYNLKCSNLKQFVRPKLGNIKW